MGKKVRTPKDELLAEAPSVRKGEVFRATRTGLERVQVNELRNGGKYHRKDQLPYNRIATVSHEKKVTRKGSWILAAVGVVFLLGGIGVPGLSLIPNLPVHVGGSRLSILGNAFSLQNLAISLIGFLLLGSRFPRRSSEEWFQIRAPDLGQDEYNGWQIAASSAKSEKLVETVLDGINRSRPTLGPD